MRAPLGPLCPGCPPQPDRGVILYFGGRVIQGYGHQLPKNKCNKICTHALFILAHESGGFAVRHCRLVIGSWGPVGCEVKFHHLTGVRGCKCLGASSVEEAPRHVYSSNNLARSPIPRKKLVILFPLTLYYIHGSVCITQ